MGFHKARYSIHDVSRIRIFIIIHIINNNHNIIAQIKYSKDNGTKYIELK